MNLATRIEQQPAWILHRRPYRETSALLELFTYEHGRLGAVARGVKNRGWSALIEPFVPLRVSWGGRSELKSINDLEQAGRSYRLSGVALACGFYMAELIMALTRREDPHPRTWQAYGIALDGIMDQRREPLLRCFEVALLEECGYGLAVHEDVHGAQIQRSASYLYYPQRGPVPVAAAAAQGHSRAGDVAVMVGGATLLALAEGDKDYLGQDPGRLESRQLLRAVIDKHLNGKRLHSREMFRGVASRRGLSG
ncbi:DNA repair protein RecO [Halorhodospira halochloris]|uniref:DNA repair protein RecO n=1 Tax=Halorhodospira halochloris TaxID=1052 RepID=A0A0X8XA99_HALHR|nr:DNA repair protein RecO [Halorhodospira halochloris]MBK1652012.1 DNA repair protein RecO [Halorhodospira halochloris]MCG5530896.1 DNA repair protein RecO [Halorhodospira halochloris]MCG5547890.1 DNA repair protein RecO [Halorhodospira halochloris]BAU58310.1 DNA recombination and repair protein RecO [Halorhodospira halochloris]